MTAPAVAEKRDIMPMGMPMGMTLVAAGCHPLPLPLPFLKRGCCHAGCGLPCHPFMPPFALPPLPLNRAVLMRLRLRRARKLPWLRLRLRCWVQVRPRLYVRERLRRERW